MTGIESAPAAEPTLPRSLKTILQSVRREFGIVMLVSCFINVLALTSALYMLQVFDRVLSGQSYETLFYLTLIALLAIGVGALLELSRKRILARAGHWFETTAAPLVVRAGAEETTAGRKPTATLADVARIRAFIAGEGVVAFFDAPCLPVFLAVLFLLHPWLGAMGAGGAVVLFACAALNDRVARRRAAANKEGGESAQEAARDLQANAEVLRALGMNAAAFDRWRKRFEQRLDGTLFALDGSAGITALSRFIRLALQIGILGCGAYLVLVQQLSPGGMIAGSILLARALAPVEKSIQGWRMYLLAREARANLSHIIETGAAPVARQPLPVPAGNLRVSGVQYGAKGLERPILRTITFDVAAGETLGIVGPSGAGKSALCRLLVGAQPPSGGSVRLDGADIFANADQLGCHIGYLPQDITFLSGTVSENIARFGDGPPERVIEAARISGIHDSILGLPQGYETNLGAQGPRLSGGQRQRIALARALYGNPRFVVLDEPNSNLDGEGEAALVGALAALKASGATVVLVSHQPSLMRGCDKMLVLVDGAIARFGPRDDVMAAVAAKRQRSVAAE